MTAPSPQSYLGYPPLPPIDESQVRPPKSRFLYAAASMVGGFIAGLALTIFGGTSSDANPDAFWPVPFLMAGMGLMMVGLLGGKAWLILLIVQRSSSRKKLQLQQRAQQMGWTQPGGWA